MREGGKLLERYLRPSCREDALLDLIGVPSTIDEIVSEATSQNYLVCNSVVRKLFYAKRYDKIDALIPRLNLHDIPLETLLLFIASKREMKADYRDIESELINRQSELRGINWNDYASNEYGQFVARVNELLFILEQYDRIKSAPFVQSTSVTDKIPVYCFWDSGLDSAPAIVRSNISRFNKYCPYAEMELIILTDDNLEEHVVLPDYAYDVRKMPGGGLAAFSDLLRCYLLEQNGGIWLDATDYITDKFFPWCLSYLSNTTQTFVTFPTYRPYRIGSWFCMVPDQHNYGMQLLQRTLDIMWMTYKDVPEYFFFHTLWELLTQIDIDLNTIWLQSPKYSAQLGIALLNAIKGNDYRFDYRATLEVVPLHKLSHKIDQKSLPTDAIYWKLLE